jgi:hypothetical protein
MAQLHILLQMWPKIGVLYRMSLANQKELDEARYLVDWEEAFKQYREYMMKYDTFTIPVAEQFWLKWLVNQRFKAVGLEYRGTPIVISEPETTE